MKKNLSILVLSLFILFFGASNINAVEGQNSQPKQTVQQDYFVSVKALDVVKNSNKYLNKKVRIKATFDKFTNLGLDYSPAMRSSQDYISFLILRDDVGENVIPLSEMKLFLTRKMAEKFIDLETGDKIQIEGTVFSSVLSDAWIDVSKITIISKKNPKKA
ncbi:hypothetical protein J6Q66_00860 [bacterium]|nr:hypothetical protein [bacterium]